MKKSLKMSNNPHQTIKYDFRTKTVLCLYYRSLSGVICTIIIIVSLWFVLKCVSVHDNRTMRISFMIFPWNICIRRTTCIVKTEKCAYILWLSHRFAIEMLQTNGFVSLLSSKHLKTFYLTRKLICSNYPYIFIYMYNKLYIIIYEFKFKTLTFHL